MVRDRFTFGWGFLQDGIEFLLVMVGNLAALAAGTAAALAGKARWPVTATAIATVLTVGFLLTPFSILFGLLD